MLDISSRLFTWDHRSGTFSGEASELEGELTRQGRDRLDYRDGHWGFHMRSHRTGRLLWFQRTAEHRDAEGELTHVEFRARLAPGQEIILTVFND